MLEHLYRALESPRGTRLTTPDPAALRMKLYAARRACPDPALAGLGFVIPKSGGELWIVKLAPSQEPVDGQDLEQA